MAGKRFFLPTEIVTGIGCFEQLGELVRPFGQRALLVGSPGRRALLQQAADLLAAKGVEAAIYAGVGHEPTLDVVDALRAQAQAFQAEVCIGIGGGSALDAAKAAAGLFRQPGTAAEYHTGRPLSPGGAAFCEAELHGYGAGRHLTHASRRACGAGSGSPGGGLPLVAVPTTAGTGAEVTKNAVLTDPERRIKESIRADSWFPALAVLDPALTVSLPPQITASTGADALCQAIESFVSIGAGPVSDPLAAEAIRRTGRSLEQAVTHGDDLAARSNMLYGSLLAGMAMTNARLGAVHGLAHPLGARYAIAHGTICGLLLPYVMAYNVGAAPEKYAQVAEFLGIDSHEPAQAAGERAAAWVRDLLLRIGIPEHLAPYGVRTVDFTDLIAEALQQSSLKHNPRPMQAEDVRAILEQAL